MSDRLPGPVTLAQVARHAGVSLATASRVLNGSSRRVRADLAARVVQAAAELNYSANAQAQAVARGRTNVVGLLVHDIADPFFSSIAAGVIRAAERQRLIVTIANTDRRPERELEYLAAMRSQRVCAVILAGSRVADQGILDRLATELRAFQATGARVAGITQNRLPVDTVVVENRAGGRALAETLVARGYRRFAVLAGPQHLLTAQDRLAGFRQGLQAAGIRLPADHVVHGEFTRDGGHAAVGELLARGLDVDCVFAVNDVMAVGAMAALRERGLRLPGDLAVAGFDDIATLRDVTPSLTTVRLPLEEIGTAAMDLIASGPAGQPRLRRIRGEVVVRNSTPPLPARADATP